MNNTITFQQFLVRQPSFPDEQPTDKYYWQLSCTLLEEWENSQFLKTVHPGVKQRAVLDIVGYYQDVIEDAGIWHAFIDQHWRMYGKYLPFYDTSDDDYIPYELNLQDVKFMLWYSIAMLDDKHHLLSPLDEELTELGNIVFQKLEEVYDEAPRPIGFKLTSELSIYSPEDEDEIYRFGNWLSMHCYLMMPAYAQTLSDVMARLGENINDRHKLQEALAESMMQNPTGPLALFIREWIHLILEGKMPNQRIPATSESAIHPYYKAIQEAGYNRDIFFFANYDELNDFFIHVLGWKEGEEHLSQLKGARDYVVLANEKKGLLVARDVARNINHPENRMYDKEFARENAIKMATVRGYCPADLTSYAFKNGWITDACFDNSSDTTLVIDNYDFLERCYLQIYYRD